MSVYDFKLDQPFRYKGSLARVIEVDSRSNKVSIFWRGEKFEFDPRDPQSIIETLQASHEEKIIKYYDEQIENRNKEYADASEKIEEAKKSYRKATEDMKLFLAYMERFLGSNEEETDLHGKEASEYKMWKNKYYESKNIKWSASGTIQSCVRVAINAILSKHKWECGKSLVYA